MIFGLKHKLMLGLGGLLGILLVVSALGIAVMTRYRGALDKFFYENWRSVEYAQGMIDALGEMNQIADRATKTQAPQREALRISAAGPIGQFEQNLDQENHNITLPGEARLAGELTGQWSAPDGYRATLFRVLSADPSIADYQSARDALAALSPKVKASAQAILHLNLENMRPIDGRAKEMADSTSRLMLLLAGAGILIAFAFFALIARSILSPIGTLTRSMKEVERGNLDLVVQVQSRDELHQMAEAFNSMAAKLREFRRTNRAKLLRTQQTTQLAINSLPDVVAVLSPDGRVEMANAAAQRLFGLKPDANVHDLRAGWLLSLYQNVTADLKPLNPRGYDSTVQAFDEGGEEKFFLPHAVPILDDEAQLQGITIVLADITNLRRLDEMKSGLVSVVSHELKTPLTSIRMGVHLLLEERIGSLSPRQNDLLAAVRDDSERLNQIVENLLDMSRIESGRALMETRPQSAESLVSQAVDPLRASFHDRGVSLELDVPTETPPVMADPARIGHVFSNLLLNALKYTPPGGSVRLESREEEGFVRFLVHDTGRGIPPQFADRVFERFFRVPGQPGATGAGLGLAIAREIVEAHGGHISFTSRERQGSTFSFTLPKAPPAAPGYSSNPNGKEATHAAV